MASKLAKLMMSRMEIECQARCPMVMPLEKEVIYASKLWLHRLKDDVDRMTTGKRSVKGKPRPLHLLIRAPSFLRTPFNKNTLFLTEPVFFSFFVISISDVFLDVFQIFLNLMEILSNNIVICRSVCFNTHNYFLNN